MTASKESIAIIKPRENKRGNEKLGDGVKFVFSPDVILCGCLGSKHQLTNVLTN